MPVRVMQDVQPLIRQSDKTEKEPISVQKTKKNKDRAWDKKRT